MCDTAGFSAGNAGPKVKSDCRVIYSKGVSELDVRSDGGEPLDPELSLPSARNAAEALGVSTGTLTVTDLGAEPFVIRARTEAALLKAFPDLSATASTPSGNWTSSGMHRPRRSRLYVPGNNPRFFAKAVAAGADGVILDLEDSVAPDRKLEARILVSRALASLDFGRTEIMVRINQGEMGLEDLAWVVPQPVQMVLIPKVECSGQVTSVETRIREICRDCGREEPVWLMPIIESPQGVLDALSIGRATESSVALTLGLQDLSAEMCVTPTEDGRESFVARSLIVLAARAAGLQPNDTVYADVKNMEGLRESVRQARMLGFVGKGCIHPGQVEAINDGFLPTAEEIARAKKIVAAMRDAESRGLGAVSLGTRMVDPPVAAQALNLIENAIALGILGPDWEQSDSP